MFFHEFPGGGAGHLALYGDTASSLRISGFRAAQDSRTSLDDVRSGVYVALHNGQEASATWNILKVISLVLLIFN